MPASVGGRALIDPRPASAHPVGAYAELFSASSDPSAATQQRAVIAGTQKLIVWTNGTTEAYDLASDPGETRTGNVPHGDQVALHARLGQFAPRTGTAAANAEEIPLDEATKARLRALGYGR